VGLITFPFLLGVLWVTVSPWPGGGVGLAVVAFAATVAGSLTVGIVWARKAPQRLRRVLAMEPS
jgi:hypothetical protein